MVLREIITNLMEEASAARSHKQRNNLARLRDSLDYLIEREGLVDPDWEELPPGIREKLLPVRNGHGIEEQYDTSAKVMPELQTLNGIAEIADGVYFDTMRRRIFGEDMASEIQLRPQQATIFALLLANVRMVVTGEQIKAACDMFADEQLRTGMSMLRTSIRPLLDAGIIELITHRSIGYELLLNE